MSPRGVFFLVGCLCLLGAYALGGLAPMGRVALSLGFHETAARLLEHPNWRGFAQMRARDFAKAAESFDEAGPLAGYNAGTAMAHAGQYARALETLDAYLAVFPDHQGAQTNFELVRLYYAGIVVEPDSEIIGKKDREGPTEAASIARGNARAAGTGSESTNEGNTLGLPELESTGRLGVRRIFDDYFYEANRKWLKSLQDVPGEYLSERIKHEHKRRAALGIGQPEAEDPK